MSFKLDYEFCWHTKKVEILEKKLEAEKIERDRQDEKLQEKLKKQGKKNISKRDQMLLDSKKLFEEKEEEKKKV